MPCCVRLFPSKIFVFAHKRVKPIMHMHSGFIHTSLCYQLVQTKFIKNKDLIINKSKMLGVLQIGDFFFNLLFLDVLLIECDLMT